MVDLNLDLRDRRILYELDVNARQSLAQIGKKVGLSKEVVNYRINKLIEQKVIRSFFARIETSKLGLTLFRTFVRFQNISPKKEEEFVSYIINNPRIGFFVRVEGNFDFNFIYWAKSVAEYFSFWRDFKSNFGKFIEESQLSTLEYYANFPKAFLVGEKDLTINYFECGLNEEIEIDKTDYDLLGILSDQARKPLIEIAHQLQISDKVVSYRIKKLEKLGIIHSYGVQVDLDKLGVNYYMLHLFLKDFSKERMNDLRNFGIAHPNVIYINEYLSGPDFGIELYVKTKQDYYNFLKEVRFKFSDMIRNFDTLQYPKEFKLVLFPWKARETILQKSLSQPEQM